MQQMNKSLSATVDQISNTLAKQFVRLSNHRCRLSMAPTRASSASRLWLRRNAGQFAATTAGSVYRLPRHHIKSRQQI
jgi:hypothetical protein